MNSLKYDFLEKINITTDLGIHALILFALLTTFFLLYVSKLTKSELNNQLSDLINNNIQNELTEYKNKFGIKELLPKNTIDPILNKLKLSYNKPDNYQDLNNNWVKETLILSNLFLLILIVGFVLILSYTCNLKINIKEILKINILTIIGIGIVEYLFFTRVALNYVPTKPSLMVSTIFDNLKNYFA